MPFGDDDDAVAHKIRERINEIVRTRDRHGLPLETVPVEFLRHLLHVWK